MDIHILDQGFKQVDVVDDFVSLVWNERRDAFGDFILDIPWTKGNAETFAIGTRIAIPRSYRVMTVETLDSKTAEDGSKMLTVTGRSIEAWMLDRSTRLAAVGGTTGLDVWNLVGTPSEIVHAMFDARCRNNVTIPADNFPNLAAGSFLDTGSIVEPTDEYSVQVELESVYDFIKKVCETFALGFRLIRNPSTFELHFEVYTGDDRTTFQTVNEHVIFSSSLDNLLSQSSLLSQADAKNVAYVFGKNGSEIVYADTENGPSLTGPDRRVLFVNADDVDLAPGTELTDVLTLRGLQELAKNRSVIALDGEVPQSGSYSYGTDYNLGDLLEMRGEDGLATNMRVTEQIFISDAQGDRSYPTLVSEMLISSGYWYGWGGNVFWDDGVGYWEDA